MSSPRLRSDVAAIVLAAGASTRFGPERNKLTEEIGGKPMVACAVDAIEEAGIESTYVILGFDGPAVEAALHGRDYHAVLNPNWERGMGGSLASGIQALPPNRFRGVLVCVADLPDIDAQTIGRVLEQFSESGQESSVRASREIVVPTHAGRRGHPVLFGAAYFSELGRLAGDRGGKQILSAHPASVIEVETDSDAILRDVDTPADLTKSRGARRQRPQ